MQQTSGHDLGAQRPWHLKALDSVRPKQLELQREIGAVAEQLRREIGRSKSTWASQFGEMMLRKGVSLAMISLLVGLGPSPLTVEMALAEEPPALVQMVDSGATSAVQKQAEAGSDVTSPATGVVERSQFKGQPKSGASAKDEEYINLTGFPFPLGPFFERKTVETELVKNKVYSFEQELKLSDISANVRSTVFRMRNNKLLVYNPVAPTKEFLAQLDALNSDGVAHILLGATQYEHKEFVGPFARQYPDAKVWAVPGQWAFPVNLPAKYFGIDTVGTGGGDLIDTAKGSAAYANAPDFTDEFEVKLLQPEERLGFGYHANEAALFHKDTKILAVTDSLVNVPRKPTPIYMERELLGIGDNARDSGTLGNYILKAAAAANWQGTAGQEIKNFYSQAESQGTASEQLQRGWERNALLSLYFGPSPSTLIDPDPSFQKLADKWIVAPVTNSLIYGSDRVKPELTRWINDVTQWDFNFISPGHFDARPGTPKDVRAAFEQTLASSDAKASVATPYDSGDLKLLTDLSVGLKKLKVI